MSPRRRFALILAGTLLLAACGGSDEASDSTEASVATTDGTTTTVVAPTTSPPTTVPATTAPPTTDAPATTATVPPTTEPVEPEPGMPTVDEVDPDGRLSAAALELLTLFDGKKFPSAATDDGVTNGPLFVELASVSAVPSVTAAALDGARRTHCFYDENDCAFLTQDTIDVLVSHLTLETDPGVVLSALAFADPVMSRTSVHDEAFADQVFGVVVALGTASDDPRLDRAVIGALGTQGFYPGGPAFRGSAELDGFFQASIASADEHLAYTALNAVNMGNPDDFPDSDNFYGVVTAQLDDPSVIVRGAALDALSSFAVYVDDDDPRWAELFDIADSARSDPDPWIRRWALKIWASLDDLSTIQTIVADHLDDGAVAEINMTQQRYDGTEVTGGVAYGSVSLAALEVITTLTRGTDFEFDISEYEFERGADAPPIGEQVGEQAVPDARAWFAANEAAIAAAASG